jgi:RND family efflux transporter MFP subunit
VVVLTGQIKAEDEVSLGFRIDGKMVQRLVSVGDRVTPGEIVARLDPHEAENGLRAADADLTAAQAALSQAQRAEGRQRELLAKNFTTPAQYDVAQQQFKTTQAQVDAAQARRQNAQERLAYTELRAEAVGTVTGTGAESGEVVRAGQMILTVARKSGRDAVFHVPAQLIREAPNPVIEVALTDKPTVRAIGHFREVAAQADPVTRAFLVKVGLSDPPEAMQLGNTVTGRMQLNNSISIIRLPGTALTETNGKPAVWVVDPVALTVMMRVVGIDHYDSESVIISEGLLDGELVVTAGVQALRPGQKVRLLVGSS